MFVWKLLTFSNVATLLNDNILESCGDVIGLIIFKKLGHHLFTIEQALLVPLNFQCW